MNKINSILAQIEKHFTEQRSKSLFSALYTIGKDDNKHGTYNVFDLLKNEICPIDNSEVKLVDKLFFEILSPILSYLKNDLSWLCVYYLDEVNDTHNYCIFFPQDTQELHQFCSIYDFANTDTYYSELNNSSSLLFESKENTYLRTKILYFKLSNTDDVNNYQDDENLSSPIWIPIDIFKKYLNDNNDSTSISIETCIQNADVLYSKLEQDSVLIKSILMNPFYQDACLSNALDVDIEVKKIVRYMYWLSLLNNIIPFKNYYYFPANLHGKTKVGGYVLATKNSLSEEELCVFQSCANRIFSILAVLYTHHLKKITIQKSLKSAKAAIMSRNMSHNLGSHVMFYIKQKLQSVSKIIDNKVLANIIPGELSDLKTIEQKIKENKDVELPFLVGLGRFINYLQERQDYIATIATDYIPANSTISFKDFVYDELKPELRYQRHHSNSDDAGWKSSNLLLDYIAYSEGYRSCDDIEILFGEFNGSSPVKDTNPDKDFQKLREFNIAVPGGVIGRQALFSIFENIIRNAAKHSERRSDNKLVLQLSLLEKDSVLFTEDEFRAKRNDDKVDYDKCGLDLKKLYANNFDRYHFLRIKVDMPNPSDIIDTLVNSLADPYIDDNGAMKETTKGLKEMRISAAWLRGYSIDTDIPADEPPALSIYTEPYSGDDTKVTISYIICIPKPCRVAFVVECDNRDILNDLLTPYGCKVFTDPFKLKDEEDRDKLINEITNYEIVCMSEDNRDLCSRISSRYIANQDKSAELLEELKGAITKNYEETLKQEAEQAQIEAEKNPTEENKKKAESAKENLSKVDDIKKKAINAAIGFVYEEWFNTVYNDITPKLVIADEKAFKDKEKECEKLNDGKEDKDRIILKTTSQMLQADCTDNIIYSTHFKGLGFDTTDYGQMLTASACIESITGNNSTARILRQDEWNEEWKYKLLSSGLAKVAIFDERIFNSFIMRDSASKHDMLFPTVDDIRKAKEEKQDQDFYDYLKGYEIHEDDASDIYYNLSTIEEVLARYNNKCKYNCDVAQRNHERRIYAFDIRVGEKETVNVVGYNVNIRENVGQYANHEKDAEIIIAQITYKDKNVKVEITDMGQEIFEVGDKYSDLNKEKSSIFDYITIHQGVLDKIYTAFGIKNDEEEKYKVTNAIHRSFSKYDTPAEVDKFLPNFIIHSGRSKPSKDDMPQKQPFVQFAAIDHAVKDCKYTLVELLATAHYEK